MSVETQDQKERIWDLMEAEKRRDRLLQRISTGAWIVTFLALLFMAVEVGVRVYWGIRAAMRGAIGAPEVLHQAMPLIWVIGGISLLVAVFSTAGVFLRLRVASLGEIRLRLAAVEELLKEQVDANGGAVL